MANKRQSHRGQAPTKKRSRTRPLSADKHALGSKISTDPMTNPVKSAALAKSSKSQKSSRHRQVRLVGIGASAGGLEALERLFDAMPSNSGLAFAIVQHLSPDFKSMMNELLGRHSPMRICHAADGQEIEPNTVYLNPPRQNLVVQNGCFYLKTPDSSETPNHPIDAFFASLAKERVNEAIGIILSGTGNDGTKGALAVMAAGGTMLIQDPGSAKFESMPRSAIEAGAASISLIPDEMPLALERLIAGKALIDDQDGAPALDPEEDILNLLERSYGANFAYYKRSTVGRRITRRAALCGIQNLANYAELLRQEHAELERLYADLLIGVTAFFRDSAAFDALTREAFPQFARKMKLGRQIRIWAPGCASGEEAYSIGIAITEFARKRKLPLNVKIFATDLHSTSLETAGRGVYKAAALKDLPPELVQRYFDQNGQDFHVKPALRKLVAFSAHNLIKDPPFTHIDLVSCRNLLIYFDETAQKKVIALFHFALNKDGIIFLGPSETLGDMQKEFAPLDERWRVFKKMRDIVFPEATRLLPLRTFGTRGNDNYKPAKNRMPAAAAIPSSLRQDRRPLLLAYDEVLARYAPPALLLTRGGELAHVFGAGQKYLKVKAGAFSLKIGDVAIEPIKFAIADALEELRKGGSQTPSTLVELSGEGVSAVEVRCELLSKSLGGEDYVLVTLTEQKPPASNSTKGSKKFIKQLDINEALQGRVEQLERTLHHSEESLQTTIEELETSNEELQSTNEELMSSNEELQSTNEELHSVNEELYTVSAEHQRKIEELTALTIDIDHILRSSEIGTIFIDPELRIRRFTLGIANIFNLFERDIGRPIADVSPRFFYPGIAGDVSQVASTGVETEQSITSGNMTFLMRVIPYKILDKMQGVVVTLIDTTRLKLAEKTLEARNLELGRANQSLQQFTNVVAHDLRAPLRTLLNSAKWIEEDLGQKVTSDVSEHCDRIKVYAKRLTDMLDDLLSYARLGEAPSMIEMVDVSRLIADIAESIDGDQRLTVNWVARVAPFRGHLTPLKQVFQNLIDNALKHSTKPSVSVTVAAIDLGAYLRFSVGDDGPGIPQRHHDKVFLPFRRLEQTREPKGTGMGLALVKKAVEDHGGRIEIISDPEVQPGTTFIFTWPKALEAGAGF